MAILRAKTVLNRYDYIFSTAVSSNKRVNRATCSKDQFLSDACSITLIPANYLYESMSSVYTVLLI